MASSTQPGSLRAENGWGDMVLIQIRAMSMMPATPGDLLRTVAVTSRVTRDGPEGEHDGRPAGAVGPLGPEGAARPGSCA
jgi:hypothetical protein